MKQFKTCASNDCASKIWNTYLVDIAPGFSTVLGSDGHSMKNGNSDIT